MCKLNDRLLSLYKAAYGLVFFATPHHGGENARSGDMVASIAQAILSNLSNNYLEALKSNSYFAEVMRNDFRERQEDFFVRTFFETLPMPHIGIVSCGFNYLLPSLSFRPGSRKRFCGTGTAW